jgi:hypothetical protein
MLLIEQQGASPQGANMKQTKEFGIATREQLEALGIASEIARVSTKTKTLAQNLQSACNSIKDKDLRAFMLKNIQTAINALDGFETMAKLNEQSVLNTF